MQNINTPWHPGEVYAYSTFRMPRSSSPTGMSSKFSKASVFNPVCHKCGIPIDYYRREAKQAISRCKSCRSKMWIVRTFGNPHSFRVVEFELEIVSPFNSSIQYVGHYCDTDKGVNTMRVLKGLLPQYALSDTELSLLYTDQLRNLFQTGGISEYTGHHSESGRCICSLTISVELWNHKVGDVPEPGFIKVVE